MGYVKNKILDIEEMYHEGIPLYEISNLTGIPITDVIHALEMTGCMFDDSAFDEEIDEMSKLIGEYTAE